MKGMLVVLGILILASTVFARPVSPLWDKYDETSCWASYVDSLIADAQCYYDGEPPAYLETYREQLGGKGGLMYYLELYAMEDDAPGFYAQLNLVTKQIRMIQGAFWSSAIYNIIQGDMDVPTVIGNYQGLTMDLQSCLEGGPE